MAAKAWVVYRDDVCLQNVAYFGNRWRPDAQHLLTLVTVQPPAPRLFTRNVRIFGVYFNMYLSLNHLQRAVIS